VSLSQPAFTTAFMSAIASSVTGLNIGQYPQPTGYHVYVTSSNNVIDYTTYVNIYDIDDQYGEQGEVTSVTFVAVFKSLASYEFDGLIFYTQVEGQDTLEVADFVFSSAIQKPANYVMIVFITFSITTPLQFIDPIDDVIQQCEQYCQNVNCNSVANNICKSFIPFSLFNLVFLYLLGVTVDYLKLSPNVQQQVQQYGNCITNCTVICETGNPIECPFCLIGCMALLFQNPIAIFIISNNITNLAELIPQNIKAVYPINVCSGKVATLQPQNIQTTLNVVSQNQVQYIVQFFLPGTQDLFNALQILISTNTNNNYSLGVLFFNGITLPSGENFVLTISISQSQGGQ